MNEQINVLKPYDVYGDNLQSLFRTVDWLPLRLTLLLLTANSW